jgi:hypothetical protein
MKAIDSQNALIKGWLLNGRSITQLDALNMFGCFRLAARIANIREQGLYVDTEIIEINQKRVARYSLKMDYDIIDMK